MTTHSRKPPRQSDHHHHPAKFESLEPLPFLLTAIAMVREVVPGTCTECMDRVHDLVIDAAIQSPEGGNDDTIHDMARLFLAGMHAGEHARVKREMATMTSMQGASPFEKFVRDLRQEIDLEEEENEKDNNDDEEDPN